MGRGIATDAMMDPETTASEFATSAALEHLADFIGGRFRALRGVSIRVLLEIVSRGACIVGVATAASVAGAVIGIVRVTVPLRLSALRVGGNRHSKVREKSGVNQGLL